MTNAFEPVTVGATTAPNRVFMAPMTRNRATLDGLATDLMVEYYRQRSGAGLIITEGIYPSPVGQGYIATPGLHTAEHAASWRPVLEAVHEAGSTIFAQLMHTGRMGHVDLTGLTPVAPSAVKAPGVTYLADGVAENGVPHALTEEEILQTIEDHVTAARHAIEAGFDGVEIHGANGYLLQQFLSDNVNLREDQWGGSLENRLRFPLEVVRAVVAAIGADRVGLRISPGNSDQDIVETDPAETYTALLTALADVPLAYVHMRETSERALTLKVRAAWPGTFVLNPLYEEHAPHHALDELLNDGLADAVAFARPYLANPDLTERIKTEGPYQMADPKTFYGGGAEGYTDYPALSSE